MVTGTTLPATQAQFFNFDGDGAGAHWIEPFVGYSGPAAFPVQLTETFTLPVSVSCILGPDVERTFPVFGISL